MLNQSQVLIVCQFIVLQKKNTGLLILYVQITPGSDKLRYPVLFYHKPRKICWAKHPQFQPYEVVHDALARSVHYLKIVKHSRENFHGPANPSLSTVLP